MQASTLLSGLLCLAVATASVAGPSAGAPASVFKCSFGNKQVVVTGVGNKLVYQFGTLGQVEISIIADPAKEEAHYNHSLGAHSTSQQLRFQNSGYSYILHNEWNTRPNSGLGPEDNSGLVVMHNGKRIAQLICKSGPGFSGQFDFSKIPEESEDYILE